MDNDKQADFSGRRVKHVTMLNEDLAIRLCLGNMWWSLCQLGGGQPAEGGDSYLAPSAPGHLLWKGVVEGVFKILDGLAWRPLPIPKVPILVEVERRCRSESRPMIKRRVAEYLIKESGKLYLILRYEAEQFFIGIETVYGKTVKYDAQLPARMPWNRAVTVFHHVAEYASKVTTTDDNGVEEYVRDKCGAWLASLEDTNGASKGTVGTNDRRNDANNDDDEAKSSNEKDTGTAKSACANTTKSANTGTAKLHAADPAFKIPRKKGRPNTSSASSSSAPPTESYDEDGGAKEGNEEEAMGGSGEGEERGSDGEDDRNRDKGGSSRGSENGGSSEEDNQANGSDNGAEDDDDEEKGEESEEEEQVSDVELNSVTGDGGRSAGSDDSDEEENSGDEDSNQIDVNVNGIEAEASEVNEPR